MGMLKCVFCVCVGVCVCVCVWVKCVGGGQAGSWGVEYSRAFSISNTRRETSLETWSSLRCTSERRRQEAASLFSTVRPQANWSSRWLKQTGNAFCFVFVCSFFVGVLFLRCVSLFPWQLHYFIHLLVCLKGQKVLQVLLPSDFSLLLLCCLSWHINIIHINRKIKAISKLVYHACVSNPSQWNMQLGCMQNRKKDSKKIQKTPLWPHIVCVTVRGLKWQNDSGTKGTGHKTRPQEQLAAQRSEIEAHQF